MTEEPKIINIKNNLIEILEVSESDACNGFRINRNKTDPPVMAMVDLSGGHEIRCGLMKKVQMARMSGAMGLIISISSPEFRKNHCKMFDDNNFFTAVIEPSDA